MAVARAALPVPVVCRVKVTVCVSRSAPHTTELQPPSDTVSLPLFVTCTVPVPVELKVALLLAPVRPELNDSSPSTNWSSTLFLMIAAAAETLALPLHDALPIL